MLRHTSQKEFPVTDGSGQPRGPSDPRRSNPGHSREGGPTTPVLDVMTAGPAERPRLAAPQSRHRPPQLKPGPRRCLILNDRGQPGRPPDAREHRRDDDGSERSSGLAIPRYTGDQDGHRPDLGKGRPLQPAMAAPAQVKRGAFANCLGSAENPLRVAHRRTPRSSLLFIILENRVQ